MASEISHHQLLFQQGSNSRFRYNQRVGSGPEPDGPAAGTTDNNGKATRELTGFIDHQNRYYETERGTEFRSSVYNSGPVYWDGGNGRGSRREVVKVGSVVPSGNDLNDTRPSTSENHQQEPSQYQNAVALVDRDEELYYPQYLHGTQGSGSGSGSGFKDMAVENGCGSSGRKDVSYSGESGDSLRSILSDPLTGALMDDAMILPCGHSFGSGGLQHVMRMKACYTCSHPVTEGSVASNLSLRSAVSAFRREEELQVHHTSKRRRERLDQDKMNYNNSMFMDTPRCRGLQFPFSLADRVIIKGNKRTPERFVGCEAVVTTQCLNGWYVVKTLDNAESIKVQYRSLIKVSDNSSSQPISSVTTPIREEA